MWQQLSVFPKSITKQPRQLHRWRSLPLCYAPLSLSASRNFHTSFRSLEGRKEHKHSSKEHNRAGGTGAEQYYTQKLQALAWGESRFQGRALTNILEEMETAGVKVKERVYTALLKRCKSERSLKESQRLHVHLLSASGPQHQFSPSLYASLINAFGACGRADQAYAVFEARKEQGGVWIWNAMIQAYTQCRQGKTALELFQQMQQAGVSPDSFTYTTALKACALTENLEMGKSVHAQLIRRGLLPNIVLSTSLISMYGKCGKIEEARAVFQEMKDRNVVAWNAMIAEEARRGHGQEALELFRHMQQAGVSPDSFTYATALKACAIAKDLEMGKHIHAHLLRNGFLLDIVLSTSLISMYGKCGKMEEARTIFQEMKERNVMAWNTMIAEETQCGYGKEALDLFHQMQQAGVSPDSFTYATVLKACAHLGHLEMGKHIHDRLLRHSGLPDLVLSTALISMYGECGKVEDAHAAFQQMKERDVVSWNAMIATHGLHGQGQAALATFHEMQRQGVSPNATTFINVLNACSHSGLVEEGLACFVDMKEKHGIQQTVEHYNCAVDLLGRAGRLDEAEKLINAMEVPPDAVTWKTLLGACRGIKDVERARRAMEQAIALNPTDAAPFVVLSNIYAAMGRWEDKENVRMEMEQRQVKKEPGRSWITVDGRVHSFVVKDLSHPRSTEIYQELDRLSQQIKAAGYKPDTNWVLHDVPDEQKETELCHHSEKLAIAFGQLVTPPGQPLWIMKNLRVCGDCHTATKFIAKVTQREILVRDANRFHHFSPNGQCSCGDYW
ncbi:DYW domain containing protein [Balamuthia mandrillaris]